MRLPQALGGVGQDGEQAARWTSGQLESRASTPDAPGETCPSLPPPPKQRLALASRAADAMRVELFADEKSRVLSEWHVVDGQSSRQVS